jgi:hypothetical protein
MKDANKTKAQLMGELAELRQQKTEWETTGRQQQVLSHVREEVWGMSGSGDIEYVVEAVRRSLVRLSIPFKSCGVSVLEASPLFSVSEITDGPRFCAKLKQAGNRSSPNPGKRIWDLMPTEIQSLIKTSPRSFPLDNPQDEQNWRKLVAALNAILVRRDLALEQDLSIADLPAYTQDLLMVIDRDSYPIRDIEQLNRLLIEAVFPDEVVKSSIISNENPPKLLFYFTYSDGRVGRSVHPVSEAGAASIAEIWHRQQTIYRRNLHVEDPYGELRWMHREGICCLVDVPFAHGTLAVSSSDPGAFSPEDIQILETMSQVLSEGFQRLDDLRNLEQRNRELEKQIILRQRMEEEMKERSRLEGIYDMVVTCNHEMNQPLTAILCGAQMMLLHAEDGSEMSRDAKLVEEAGLALSDIIQKIADLRKTTDVRTKEYLSGVDMIDID